MVRRTVRPICLENISETEFMWLLRLSNKRVGNCSYSFHYKKRGGRAYLKVWESGSSRVLDNSTCFETQEFYDTVTSEITRLNRLLEDFRRDK